MASDGVQGTSGPIPQLDRTFSGDSTVYGSPVLAHYRPLLRSHTASTQLSFKLSRSWNTIVFLADILLAAVPCIFLVLAAEALSAGKSSSLSYGSMVNQAAKVSPTIFPIVFATTIGRLMRTWALWKAERGARLGILEQMVGSQNLTSAIERAILLSGVGFWSICIVMLWLLSPLGGQASIRVNSPQQVSTVDSTTVYYFNNTGDGINGAFVGAGISSMKETSLNSILHATLLSMNQNKRHDIWGNIRIPCWDYVVMNADSRDEEGWYNFVQDDNTEYSSMTGIVVSSLQDNLDTNFTLQSSEFSLTCSEPHFFPMNVSKNGTARYGGFAEWAGPLLIRTNMSQDIFSNEVGNEAEWNSYLLDTNWAVNTSDPNQSFNVIYASQGAKQVEIGAYDCAVKMMHTESDVLCKGSDCQVRRVRLHKSNSSTPGNIPFSLNQASIPFNMLKWLSSATWMSDWYIVSPVDWYVSGSNAPFPRVDMIEYSDRDLTYRNISTDTVSVRLSSLINTAYQSSYQLSATSQPPSQNITALSLGLNSSTAAQGLGYTTINTTATTVLTQSRFVASIPWIATTIVIALIMLFCGMATLVFKYTSHAPDILGYVSSMTRDNPDFDRVDIDREGTLNGLQRARKLKNLVVQITSDRFKGEQGEQGYFTMRNLGYAENIYPRRGNTWKRSDSQRWLSPTKSEPKSPNFLVGYKWVGGGKGAGY